MNSIITHIRLEKTCKLHNCKAPTSDGFTGQLQFWEKVLDSAVSLNLFPLLNTLLCLSLGVSGTLKQSWPLYLTRDIWAVFLRKILAEDIVGARCSKHLYLESSSCSLFVFFKKIEDFCL